MSIISSKQVKKHGLVDSIFVFFLLIIALLVLMPSGVNTIRAAFEGVESRHLSISANRVVSFATDLQYWNVYCRYGWSSNSRCESIALKAQACTADVDSVYCSEYNYYLQKYFSKNPAI